MPVLSTQSLFSQTTYSVCTSDGWSLKIQAFLPKRIKDPRPWLCVHGFSQSHLTWTAGGFAQQIASWGSPVYVVDLRGHGGSTQAAQPETSIHKEAEEWSVDDYFLFDLPAAMAFVRNQHEGEALFLCGHSMGGLMVVATAIRLREEGIAGVVAIAAPFSPNLMGKRLQLPARMLNRLYPWLQKASIPWKKLPMAGFLSLMGQFYYAGKPKMGRLLPYVVPHDPLQLVPRLWHPEQVKEEVVQHVLAHSFPEPMKVVCEWSRWVETGSVCFGHPAAIDYSCLYHRVSVPIVAVWGEDDFLAPPRTGEYFRTTVRSKQAVFLSLPKAHHIDITVGKPAQDILAAIAEWMR